MKILLTETQVLDFINKKIGFDLSDRISIITTANDLPEIFRYIDRKNLNFLLNHFGPAYLLRLDDGPYLIQNQGDSEKDYWVIADDDDTQLSESQLLKKLGVFELGFDLKFLLNNFFFEEPLNEEVEKENEYISPDKLTNIIQHYLETNLENYYGIKKFWVDYNEQLNGYDINVFFDKQLAIEMGLEMKKLRTRVLVSISQELNSFFKGTKFYFYEHYED